MQRVNSDHSNALELVRQTGHDGRCEDWGSRKKDSDDRGEEAAPWKIVLGA
jgi:hypothetical protein